MDNDTINKEWAEQMWVRFFEGLSQKNFEVCEQIQAIMGDVGYENDAINMGHKIVSSEKEETYTWEPVEPKELMIAIPEELEAPYRMSHERAREWEHPTDSI